MQILCLGNATHFNHILVEMKNIPKLPYSVSFLGCNANRFHSDIEKKNMEYVSSGAQMVKVITLGFGAKDNCPKSKVNSVGRQEGQAGGAGWG